MSEQEFESYLRLLCRFLHLSGTQREKISRELRGHMEERLEDLMARGLSREDAIASALDEFGDAAVLAGDFGRIGRRRRWIMRTTGGIVGIAAAVLFVSFLLPENRRRVPGPAYSVAADDGERLKAARPTSQPAARKLVVAASTESKAELEARAILAKVMPEVVFPDGSTLEQVLDYLRAQAKLSIDVNWNALNLVGIDRTAALSLDLHNVKLERALSLALENVGAASGVQLGYEISDGILRISTIEELNRKTFIRIYDCKDLTAAGFSSSQLNAIADLFKQETGKPFSSTHIDALKLNARAVAENDLINLIKHHVGLGSWEPEGTTGCLTIYDGFLVVHHTPALHRQLVELMEMLREARLARENNNPERSLSQASTE